MTPAIRKDDGHAVKAAEAGAQILTFTLHGEQYGIDILRVQEIKGFSATTPIPHAPPHVRGVMNLRGTVIPVVDLRVRFGLPPAEQERFAVIIVVALERRLVGMLVDAVSDVLDVPPSAVQPPPDVGADRARARCVAGTARIGEQLVVLLDVAHVLASDDGDASESLEAAPE